MTDRSARRRKKERLPAKVNVGEELHIGNSWKQLYYRQRYCRQFIFYMQSIKIFHVYKRTLDCSRNKFVFVTCLPYLSGIVSAKF